MMEELDIREDEVGFLPRIPSKVQKLDEPQDGDPENPQTKNNTFPFVIHSNFSFER